MGPKKKKVEMKKTERMKTRNKKQSVVPLSSTALPLPDIEIKKEIEEVEVEVKFSLDPCDYEALKPWACPVCQKCFKMKADLRKHERIHTGEKPYSCPICFKAFAIAGNLSKHRAVHSTERPYKCKICDKTYKQQKHLKSHLDVHSGVKNYHCDICGKDFVHSWSWHCHMSNHSGVFKYKCDVCEKGFNISTDYKRHMFVHGGERPLKCDFCDNRFAHSTLLKRHIAIHHTARNLKCNRCDKVFDLLSDFKAHKATHKGEKHLICEFCNKGFGKLSHLKRHYKVHRNKPALCSVCKKSFRTKEELLSHTETHIDILDEPEESPGHLDDNLVNERRSGETVESKNIIDSNISRETVIGKANDTDDEREYMSDGMDVVEDVSDDNEELDDYEVCTICRKVLTTEKEFLIHMQGHIAAIDELEAHDNAKMNKGKNDSESIPQENLNSSFLTNDDENEESDDDDIICTKITNEVTGTTLVFHKDDNNCEVSIYDETNSSIKEDEKSNKEDIISEEEIISSNNDISLIEQFQIEKTSTIKIEENNVSNENWQEIRDHLCNNKMNNFDSRNLILKETCNTNHDENIVTEAINQNDEEEMIREEAEKRNGSIIEDKLNNDVERKKNKQGGLDISFIKSERPFDENVIEAGKRSKLDPKDVANAKNYEHEEMQIENRTCEKEIGEMNYGTLFAEKGNHENYFLDESVHRKEFNDINALENNQIDNTLFDNQQEINLSSIANDYLEDCDNGGLDNDLGMGIHWKDYETSCE